MKPHAVILLGCAWVLWGALSGGGAFVQMALGAWPTREECIAEQNSRVASYRATAGEKAMFVCLPDTVDPRAPAR
jgi:hypothetical protein